MTEQERDALLAALPDKQRDLVLARARGLTLKEAAKEAGMSHDHARHISTKPHMVEALRIATLPQINSKIASAEERQMFWTATLRGEVPDKMRDPQTGDVVDVPAKISDRLRASELLAKSQADFVERNISTLEAGDSLSRLLREISGKSTPQAAIDWEDDRP